MISISFARQSKCHVDGCVLGVKLCPSATTRFGGREPGGLGRVCGLDGTLSRSFCPPSGAYCVEEHQDGNVTGTWHAWRQAWLDPGVQEVDERQR